MSSILKNNKILMALVAALVIAPLALPIAGEFGGSDDQAEGVIQQVAPNYEPWFSSIWEPPSGEIESLLFALQAALGSGLLCYYIGLRHGMSKRKD